VHSNPQTVPAGGWGERANPEAAIVHVCDPSAPSSDRGIQARRCAAEEPDHRQRRLLRAGGEWPKNRRRCRAADERDKFASPHHEQILSRSTGESLIVAECKLAHFQPDPCSKKLQIELISTGSGPSLLPIRLLDADPQRPELRSSRAAGGRRVCH
jgi:hypothetical protein